MCAKVFASRRYCRYRERKRRYRERELEGAGRERGRCPLWVKSRHVQRTSSCPLYPQ